MRTFDDMLSKQLKDDEFRKEYEAIQPEMDVIRAIVDARTSQNMTQKELAERTGINQADISKLENGTRNPSVNLLKRLADGMGMALKIEFVPKQKALYQLMSNGLKLCQKMLQRQALLKNLNRLPKAITLWYLVTE
mgnify:CR=1 FL=1